MLHEPPDEKPAAGKSGKSFVLVSGLPRSGTSLMMQLLAAGGLALTTDGQRAADVDNPRGYHEWEALKQVGRRPEILDDAVVDGTAIKCVSMLLAKLPGQHRYQVIFMTRPIGEVLASQRAMTERRGTRGAELDAVPLARGLESHRDETRRWLRSSPHSSFIEVDYPTLVRDPEPVLARVAAFLGPGRLPTPWAMARVVAPELHRKKGG